MDQRGRKQYCRTARLAGVALAGLIALTGCHDDGLPHDGGTPPTASRAAATVGAVPLGATSYAVPAGALYVSPAGNDSGAGGSTTPLRTLSTAVQRAPAGTTIVLRAGVYRENVQVYRKALTIQAYPGDKVWLSGSDVVGGWVADGGAWRKDGWTHTFERTPDGASHLIEPGHPLAGWPEMAFVDGVALRQVASRSQVGPGTFFVDDPANRLYVGTNPNGHVVEATARDSALYLNGADGSVVRGIGVRQYATPVARQGAVRAYGSRLLLENMVLDDNANFGVSVIGADVVLRRNTFRRNGHLGVHGLNADRLLVERSLIANNNVELFDAFQGAGGLKLTRSRTVDLRGNHVLDNKGPGLWTDQSSYDVTVTGNLVRRNARSGIQIELTGKAIVADNVVTNSGEAGVWVLESNDVEVWNNTLLDNVRNLDVLDGPRTSSDLGSQNHDRRFPVPNPEILWDVKRVTIRNNVFGNGIETSLPLLRVDDVAHRRSGRAMEVSSDYNAYHRRSTASPEQLVLWSRWPTDVLISPSLAAFRSGTGQEEHSVARDGGANPWVTDAATGDFRAPPSSPGRIGAALPAKVADAIGVSSGTQVPIGTLSGPAGS